LGCLNQRLGIGGADSNVLYDLGGAGIARGDINIFNFGALSQLPDNGILSSATADN